MRKAIFQVALNLLAIRAAERLVRAVGRRFVRGRSPE